MLAPDQPTEAYGAEVLGVGLVALLVVLHLQRRGVNVRDPNHRAHDAFRLTPSLAAHVPFVVAGAVLMAGWDGGVYWLLPAVVMSFVSALLISWCC
jgi:modulator of FtsH protease